MVRLRRPSCYAVLLGVGVLLLLTYAGLLRHYDVYIRIFSQRKTSPTGGGSRRFDNVAVELRDVFNNPSATTYRDVLKKPNASANRDVLIYNQFASENRHVLNNPTTNGSINNLDGLNNPVASANRDVPNNHFASENRDVLDNPNSDSAATNHNVLDKPIVSSGSVTYHDGLNNPIASDNRGILNKPATDDSVTNSNGLDTPIASDNRDAVNNPTADNAAAPSKCLPLPLRFSVNASLFPCQWTDSLNTSCSHRLRAKLICNQISARVLYEWVSADTPPSAYPFEDECLRRVVVDKCQAEAGAEGKVIPRIAHHVFFGAPLLKDYMFFSVLSAVRFLQPCLVMVHSDALPRGQYWEALVKLVPQIVHVNRSAPSAIFGHTVKVIEHSADIARLEAVRRFGGVYLDADYLLLKPVDELREHAVVMGKTIPRYNYCNCIFMARPGARFLQAWYESYRTFSDKVWGFHSTVMPYNIHRDRPDLPFHEVGTLVTPYFKNIQKEFFQELYDWRSLHGIHLYVRLFPAVFKGRFERGNTTLGQVTRNILFGNSHACFGNSGYSGDVIRMKK